MDLDKDREVIWVNIIPKRFVIMYMHLRLLVIYKYNCDLHIYVNVYVYASVLYHGPLAYGD